MAINRSITIEHLPEIATQDQGKRVLDRIQNRLDGRRPGLVLDCSELNRMDKPVLQLLLSCLEEAMKRNGDARLASVCPSAQMALKLIGADRLFQIFDSSADAVKSFHQHSPSAGAIDFSRDEDRQVSENAA